MATTPQPPRVFGVDFGSQRCVVAESSGDVVLNELGGMTTATLVSFKGEERMVGEAAVLSANTNPRNTVGFFNGLIGKQALADVEAQVARLPGQQPRFECNAAGKVVATVDFGKDGAQTQFTVEQLTAMLLANLSTQMKKRFGGEQEQPYHVTLAVPCTWGQQEKRALRTAAQIAGIPSVALVTRAAALARCFHRKHPVEKTEKPRCLVIVDMGHSSTSVAAVQVTAQGETVLASEADVQLGAETIDRRLFEHFQAEVKATHGLDVQLQSKGGKRLFQSCEKLKKLLSTIAEARVTVENLAPEKDVPIALTRSVLEELCASERARLTQLVQQVLEQAEGVTSADVASVEIVGGGTRIPFVQKALLEAFPTDQQRGSGFIGRMLDSTTAVALGAAYMREAAVGSSSVEPEDSTELARCVILEQQLQARDAELAAIAHERNAIEAFVYEMRGKRHAKHGDKLDAGQVDPLLDAAEDWIYSEESEAATLDVIRAKRKEIETQVRDVAKAYWDAVAADERELDAQLEQEAAKAEAERLAEGEDDHDTRKLKKPERMRMVVKNKEEGNELFRDGNHKHAAARYVKALSHSAKFFDLTPADQLEVDALKLSLYLNLAQCYLKLENYFKAEANCRDALVLDPSSVKALYRRAVANEKLNKLELAAEDVEKALQLAPTDRAVLKLDERLKLRLKRQLDKEKKMWTKAFA